MGSSTGWSGLAITRRARSISGSRRRISITSTSTSTRRTSRAPPRRSAARTQRAACAGSARRRRPWPYVLGVAGGASPEEQRSRAALAEFLTDEIGHELTKLLRARSGAGASKGPRLLYGSTCPEWLYLLPRVARAALAHRFRRAQASRRRVAARDRPALRRRLGRHLASSRGGMRRLEASPSQMADQTRLVGRLRCATASSVRCAGYTEMN